MWQATKWPVASSRSSGSVVVHTSVTFGHRGWKRHPDGGSTGDGGSPTTSTGVGGASGSGTGIDASSTLVYGCIGARYSSSLGATSHSLPRYITATRSLMFLTTARSWAMKISVSSCLALRSSSRLSTCAWTLTSSADTGSSQMISDGSSTSDRAIEMRWH